MVSDKFLNKCFKLMLLFNVNLMYITVVELNEPYLIDKVHFKIHWVSFEKNWKSKLNYKKWIGLYKKCFKKFINWVCNTAPTVECKFDVYQSCWAQWGLS